jgi:prepilin-type N-terminal cleavage/methylation domain-containing protein
MPTPRANVDVDRAGPRLVPRRSHLAHLAHKGRGFTLIELMVVVIIVGILAVTAIPAMSYATVERRSYADAILVAELFREARTRAMGRGTAEMISMTAGAGDRGTFYLWEAQVLTAPPAGVLPLGSPMYTCGWPTTWAPSGTACSTTVAGTTATCIDGVNLNGGIESVDGIQTSLVGPVSTGGTATQGAAAVCFTPLGRTYYASGTGAPVFIAGSPMIGELQIALTHGYLGDSSGTATGVTRTIVVPNSGASRIISH